MAGIAGFNMKIDINDAPFVASQIECEDAAETGDNTNFESDLDSAGNVVLQEKIPTKGMLRVTITRATWDPTDNVFVAPYFCTRGETIIVAAYPAGRGGDFYVANIVVTSARLAADVNGLQPQTIVGESTGFFSVAGE